MHNTIELPAHPATGLTALGWRRNGAPIWPVLGGDGTTPPPDGGGGDGGEPPAGGTGDPDPDGGSGDGDGGNAGGDGDPDANQLGDAGKKALDAQKKKWKEEREKRQAAEAELEKLRNGASKEGGEGGEDDPETIRRKAQAEVMGKANERIVSAEVRAAAAGKLADPADAARFIDLTQFEVNDSGDVDKEEIGEAIEDLLRTKPYLAAGANKRFQGGGDGGQGRGSKQPSLDEQIAEAEKAGDTMRAIGLKTQKLNQTK
ncbi:hypothetical protein [Streptomonospora wellingtoniae]|uniref:EF-hand domain-containing protein n=1 Tax=Streptomonospora wellingtoniae TaxID=3075544 RepID=A0ABU2L0I5_9ACTN|nr:hypothetical protein [Streptomonospora sp. DSM 45055]MDT0305071.1 hypothetical protein [Streptomonospora sp. DSM 45055]